MRNWQSRSPLRTCSVVLAVWLNLVFQACAMASMSTGDCPHCPPEMHDGAMAMDPMECRLLESIDELEFVKPASKIEGHAADWQAPALLSWSESPRNYSCALGPPAREPRHSVHGPPPNVLFCVYLK